MNTELAFHLGWMFGGGIVALFLLWGFYSRERDLAEKFFKSKHGEAIDFSQLAGESGFFIGCVIALERARIDRLKAEAERKAVHAYHPHTPFAWLCGAESSDGKAVFNLDEITCPTCKQLEAHGPFGRAARLRKLEFKE